MRSEVSVLCVLLAAGLAQGCTHQWFRQHPSPGNLVAGANIAGFLKVANAMLDQGLV